MQKPIIPTKLFQNLAHNADGTHWLEGLAESIVVIRDRWELELEQPLVEQASCSWVAPCHLVDGTKAILKMGFPHMEARDEITGLLCWDGDPVVKVLDYDKELNAMLLERCFPGTALRTRPEQEQDSVIATMLNRLWECPIPLDTFRPLSLMIDNWSKQAIKNKANWPDPGLVNVALQIYKEYAADTNQQVVLATDLHAGNVLQAQREPWLVIDPKPFYGDPTYDATQHLLNCQDRLQADAEGTIRKFSDLLEIDYERLNHWMFARLVVNTGDQMEPAADFVQNLAPG
jgi:streptomycin 6-kinase